MRLVIGLLVCLFIFSGTALCQERIVKVMAGPNDDQFRILVSFIGGNKDQYELQSMIIDVNPVKDKKEAPASYYVDLTATVRNMVTDEKKQRIMILRWERSGDVEVKCEGGKWSKQTTGPELDKIVESIKAVVQNSPLDTTRPVEFTLPQSVTDKVTAVLNGLQKSKLLCIHTEN